MAAVGLDGIYRLDPERVAPGDTLAPTFHGRDLFAPAAARLAQGDDPEKLGDPVASMAGLEPLVETIDGSIHGSVLWVDHFGNAITAISEAQLRELGPAVEIRLAGLRIRELHQTFADVDPLTPLAYVGSAGSLEIAVRDGNLSERFGVERGTAVEVRARPEG
jgi:S-adenosylmethionine hydrolase